MKHILTAACVTLLYFTAKSQEPFVLGKTYPVGWVVQYPSSIVYWITKVGTTARTYPSEGSVWTRFYYPTPPPVVTTNTTVRQSAFDSLLVKFDSVSLKLKNIEANQQSSTIKIYQNGASLLKVIDDHTVIVRSLLPADGYDFELTDSTIKPIKRP